MDKVLLFVLCVPSREQFPDPFKPNRYLTKNLCCIKS